MTTLPAAREGQLPDPNAFTKRFIALCKRLGLRSIKLHDVRHSYVAAARRAGAELKTVSKRIDHAGTNVTLAVYDYVFSKDDTAASDSTAEILFRSGPKQA